MDKAISLENTRLNKDCLSPELGDLLIELKDARDAKEIHRASAKILNLLTSEFGLPKCRFKFYDNRRPRARGRKPKNASRDTKYWHRGLYLQESKSPPMIKIWGVSLTEILLDGEVLQAEVTLSWGSILNALLYEFVHHYDAKGLKIKIDHDLGFWKRFQHLRRLVFSHINAQR